MRETVTSENREEYISNKLNKKKLHESHTLPETQSSEIVEKHKERTWPHADSMRLALIRETNEELMGKKGWDQKKPKFYGHEMESPPKDIHNWKHYVTSFMHPKEGQVHVTVSKDKKGYSIHKFKK
jgi:hypothetical protein